MTITVDDRFPQKVWCASCGAEAQRTSAGLRCPWATSAHQRTVWVNGELLLDCGSPFERERGIVIPQQTRTR